MTDQKKMPRQQDETIDFIKKKIERWLIQQRPEIARQRQNASPNAGYPLASFRRTTTSNLFKEVTITSFHHNFYSEK